jgi:hypothetical protein
MRPYLKYHFTLCSISALLVACCLFRVAVFQSKDGIFFLAERKNWLLSRSGQLMLT